MRAATSLIRANRAVSVRQICFSTHLGPRTMTRVMGSSSVGVAGASVMEPSSPSPSPSSLSPSSSASPLIITRSIASTPENVNERITKAIKKTPVVLFMKGYPEHPMCGFSRTVVTILNREGVKFDSYNVLDDEGLREGIKKFSNWPTIPQLYVNGTFIGGADITSQLHVSGELKTMLEEAGALKPAEKTA